MEFLLSRLILLGQGKVYLLGPTLLCRPEKCVNSGGRLEVTHVDEGDGTGVKTDHNPKDACHLGQDDVQRHGC